MDQLLIILNDPSLRNVSRFQKYVAYTTAIDFIRKAKKETEALKALAHLYENPNGFSVESILEEKCMHEELYDIIGELHNDQRRLVEMFYLDESCKGIGVILEISESATLKRLQRARKLLRELIRRCSCPFRQSVQVLVLGSGHELVSIT